MARRYGSAFSKATDPTVFQTSPWNLNRRIITGAAGGIHYGEDGSRIYASPSAYSQVRKVVFWACIRHEYTDAENPVGVRLRVAPSSSDSFNRALEIRGVPESTFNITEGTGSIWTNNTINDEAVFYPPQGENQNIIQTIRFPVVDSSGTQLIYQEFDRFEAGSAEFFNDWDAAAATADDDNFIGFYVAVQRGDAVDWINSTNTSQRTPVIVASGFAVVQAPSPENNSRFYVPGTHALYSPAGMPAGSWGGPRAAPFFYHADEWDGDLELRFVAHSTRSAAGTRGSFSVQINAVQNGSLLETERMVDSFVVAPSASIINSYNRTKDIIPFLTDGDVLGVRFRSDSGGGQDTPLGHWEITQKAYTKTTVFFGSGHAPTLATSIPGGSPPPNTFGKNEGLFDPIWFEDFESDRFLSNRTQTALYHRGAGNDPEQRLIINANLDIDVNGSLFNLEIPVGVTGTPNAVVGIKLRDDPITANDPINLAGKRKFAEAFEGTAWESGTDDDPGRFGLAYVLDVPNSDSVPLGPLFDVGAFDAEGCAATSAGLGEPPLLIITNGSSIPQKFNPTAAGTAGEVEDAGIPTPFEGETPVGVAASAAASPDGGLDLGTYRYRYTFRNCCTDKESDPNLEDIVVDTSGQAPAASVTISFAGIRIPADAQICEICLYRTLQGGDFPIMAKVGCFDPDVQTTFVDDLSDSALDFFNDGISILNAPPPCVSVIVDFRNRLFGMGDIPNLAPIGTVSVVEGSDLITGDGDVIWDRCLEGKFIQVAGDCRSYEILRILPPVVGTSPAISRLRLVDEYEGSTDTGLDYVICGRPNRLYYSEPLEPECWPAANFLDIEPGDGDRLMGAVSNFDRLVICKRRKTYVLTFRENPGFEVIVPSRISSDVGCIGPRTFAQVESGSAWLADRGVALYDGRTVQHIPESEEMNDLFVDPDNPHYIRRDRNGRVIDAVGVYYPKREQYLLLLPTVQTDRGCNLMLVWDVKLRNVTLLKFCQEFLSMVVGKDTDGNERVYIGDTNGFVWIYDVGDTDGVGVPNATGTVRGDVGSAGIDVATGASVLDDPTAGFLEGGIPGLAGLSGLAGFSGSLSGEDVGLGGVCVYARRKGAGDDEPWTVRQVYASTSTRLYVTPQWGADVPYDATGAVEFEYMLGAIELDLIFKPQNYGTDDVSKRTWREVVVHEVENFSSKLRIDLLPDFQMIDPEAETVVDPVTGETGEGRVFRMDYSKGRQIKPAGRNVHFYMAVRMRNFAPEEPIRIINHLLCETPRASK
ncbi:MAG: hypothetical protein GY906_23500 [bacterium]|nr:hypothetical protein [bacterium]